MVVINKTDMVNRRGEPFSFFDFFFGIFANHFLILQAAPPLVVMLQRKLL